MSGPVALRPMRWWDIEVAHTLEVLLFSPDTWSVETFWSELAADGRCYLVAEERCDAAGSASARGAASGRLLGYAGLAVNGSQADVQTVAVAPWAQGRGVGRLLLDELVSEAAARGATSLLLEVRADNDAARALYTRNGFEQIAVRRKYYQPGDIDAHVMRLRPLAAAGGAR